jgi:hypothetical protein
VVSRGQDATTLEWAQDSTWRFMPVMKSAQFGYQLHPVDLATNKVLALAGRNEARDLVDTLYLHRHVLPLGPLIWAAVGKDPGFTPLSLLELLRRRGKIRPEDLSRLHTVKNLDAAKLKSEWVEAMAQAETFVRARPPAEVGCLYYSKSLKKFVDPEGPPAGDATPHWGHPGGVLPALLEQP